MTSLPPNASVATAAQNGKLHAPSAARNTPVIVDLLRDIAPAQGTALEIASGTGQHITALAAARRDVTWHPTEIAPDRIASIDAYVSEAALANVQPAQILDATSQGWPRLHPRYDLIYLGNLTHLITQNAAEAILSQAALALSPTGKIVIYGPFMRDGSLTSDGDAKFDAELRAADPNIGYKDDRWIHKTLTRSGLGMIELRKMPANNLAFIAQREPIL